MVPGKVWVSIDLKKVNVATQCDHYPLLYIEDVLEGVASKESYTYLAGFFG